MAQVIVLGGGLSGLAAAHTVLERGGRVLLVDKNSFLGGNSTKATSGINGALTRTQIRLKIPDSVEIFERDTAISAAQGDPNAPVYPLAKVLAGDSASAVEWLQTRFGLDLSKVSRLGGHSQPRTHRGKERFPGMTITYALMEKLEEIATKEPQRCRILVKARATKLLSDKNGRVNGVEYTKEGKSFTEYGPVVVATGGFGAGGLFSDSMLHRIRPDLLHLPTTNGEHCTGDGIMMAEAIGAATVDLDAVQVHPTGLVHPNEPDARVKFLAAEALRGVGGLLLTSDGKRFCNELGRRDYVSGMMMKNKGPFRLVLNSAASKDIEWHCKHYVGRGLMKAFKNGKEVAKELGISEAQLKETLDGYNSRAEKKSDEFETKFFPAAPFKMDDSYHVAVVCPVVHYTMGGLKIQTDASVEGKGGAPIPGLFSAGEVTGGVHGKNRLGGSALLECVVFGRVSGASAAKYLFGQLSSGAGGAGGRSGVTINVQPEGSSVAIKVAWDGSSAADAPKASAPGASTASPGDTSPDAALLAQEKAARSGSAPAATAPTAGASGGLKEYTMDEVAKHNTEKDCWVVVNGQVLNVTKFLSEHPGGKQAILLFAGKEASEEFNMLHKPDVVEKYAAYSIIGKLKGQDPAAIRAKL